jgi:peptide/nickel transport system substrate-binding protein
MMLARSSRPENRKGDSHANFGGGKMRRIAAYVVLGCLAAAVPAVAAETPKRGGELVIASEGEPNTYDCHAALASQVLMGVAPSYSTLLKFDTAHWPKIVGDLADSWSQSDDGLSYTVKLHPDVHFHDGSVLSAADVKASYDRLRSPPVGVVSARLSSFRDIATVETPDPLTVVFKLSGPNPSFLTVLASPWNCIYSAKKLAEDPTYPASTIMGTGPFTFVEYVKGSRWIGKRFDHYFRSALPYLDGFKIVFLNGVGVMNAQAAGQVDIRPTYVSPAEFTTIKTARGDSVKSQSVTLNTLTLAAINTSRKPFDDVRVRQALNLAIDRAEGDKILSKLTILQGYGGVMRPGSEMAMSSEDRAKLPGLGTDIKAARELAKKLLAEAGQSNLKLKLLNRAIRIPYEPLGIFLIDQWRQIGVTAEMTTMENGPFFANFSGGEYDVGIDFNSATSDDPTEVLVKFLPGTPINYTRFNDPTLTEFYNKQKQTVDPQKRRALVTAFQNRLYEEVPTIPLFWNERVVIMDKALMGWTVPPSMNVGYDLTGVWLDR